MLKKIIIIFLTITNLFSNNLENTLIKTIRLWNSTMNTQDFRLMQSLYANRVIYYGKIRSKYYIIKDKKRALRKYPYFSQVIDELAYDYVEGNIYKVTFNKYVKYRKYSKIKIYPSYIYIDLSYRYPKIVVEGDKVTDINLLYK